VALLLGDHAEARKRFERSLAALENKDGWPAREREGAWLGSLALVVQCEAAKGRDQADWRELGRLVRKADRIIKNSTIGDHDKQRWIDNWRCHHVRLSLVRGDREQCLRALQRANAHVKKLTLEQKDDPLGQTTRVSIEGIVAAHWSQTAKEARQALSILAQALHLQITYGGRHPEMLRDVLFSQASCLRIIGDGERAARVAAIAERTRDGSSWLFPYRCMANAET
jgi:hypothetical protein